MVGCRYGGGSTVSLYVQYIFIWKDDTVGGKLHVECDTGASADDDGEEEDGE